MLFTEIYPCYTLTIGIFPFYSIAEVALFTLFLFLLLLPVFCLISLQSTKKKKPKVLHRALLLSIPVLLMVLVTVPIDPLVGVLCGSGCILLEVIWCVLLGSMERMLQKTKRFRDENFCLEVQKKSEPILKTYKYYRFALIAFTVLLTVGLLSPVKLLGFLCVVGIFIFNGVLLLTSIVLCIFFFARFKKLSKIKYS